MGSALANRYAEAVVAVAGEQSEATIAELRRLVEAFKGSDAVRQLLTSPVIRAEDRQKGLTLLAEKLELAEPVRRLLTLLVQNRRGTLVPLLADTAAAANDRRLGRQHLQVTTARAWSDAEQGALVTKMNAGDARIDWNIDTTLLGGVRVQRDDLVWDGSIRKQMNRLQELLTR